MFTAFSYQMKLAGYSPSDRDKRDISWLVSSLSERLSSGMLDVISGFLFLFLPPLNRTLSPLKLSPGFKLSEATDVVRGVSKFQNQSESLQYDIVNSYSSFSSNFNKCNRDQIATKK